MNNTLKAILIDCIPPQLSKEDADARLTEAENLINTYGGLVVIKKIQKRQTPDYKTFVGSGKLEEIINESKTTDANIIIINNELKPHQTYNINERLRKFSKEPMLAWDRIDLILKIFQKHATTREAKLEIELASIKHMGPRIFGMGMQLSRQGGGIGTRGSGETNIEAMKRHLRKMEDSIRDELEECKKVRKLHRDNRKRRQLKTVGIIGYTNAGKSTLLNALTKKGAYVANKLFATLDTRVGKMYIDGKEEILISDTIGFIQDLPTTLIKSFQSTLEESTQAEVLLHVIDVSDPRVLQKIEVVNKILFQIDALMKPTIYVFNKVDALSQLDRKRFEDSDEITPESNYVNRQQLKNQFKTFRPCFVSATNKEGLQELKQAIKDSLS